MANTFTKALLLAGDRLNKTRNPVYPSYKNPLPNKPVYPPPKTIQPVVPPYNPMAAPTQDNLSQFQAGHTGDLPMVSPQPVQGTSTQNSLVKDVLLRKRMLEI